ncbi:MAG: pilus assembly protein PilF [Betaproteobacteria bacterium HGW-Betaproteobacteria-14]|nr:MAG: pilus assembly protein PilF [Betaproteobacteria bacterium HGW-Betaproteobacteria-14]
MRLPFLAVLTAIVLSAAAYWPGLHGGFFFDDAPNILQDEGVRMESLSVTSLREALGSGLSGPSGRPVAQLSFALNHYFNGGFDPFAFKATNLVIHALAGLLVFFLGLRLVGAGAPQLERGRVQAAAAILAALWLLHPLQLTTVLYAVQRMTGLAALFLFAALLLHVQGREGGGRAGLLRLALAWGLLWPLSFLSKETGVLFPLFALAWELILGPRTHGRFDRFARVLAVLVGLTFAAGAIYAALPAGQWLWAGYDFRSFSPAERLLTEGRVLWFYLGLALLPRLEAFSLHHDDFALSTGLLVPWTTLLAWAGLAGLVWLALRLRAKAPMASFGIAWFLIGHLLESTVLPLELVHEHRNYVPLFGVLLALASALPQALAAPGPRKTLCITLAAVGLGYCGFVTALRAHQFGDETRRSQIEVQHHPDSARAHYEAGRAVAMLDQSADAEGPTYFFARTHFERAGELDPGFKLGWLGLMHLSCRAGKPVEAVWTEALGRRLRETPLGPGDQSMMFNLKEMAIAGALCVERADVESLFAAARANPLVTRSVRAKLHSWLADYLVLGARDAAAARAELDLSLAIAPYNPSNRLKRAQLALLLGQHEEARGMLAELSAAKLNRPERETYAQMQACLESQNASACIAK